MSTAPAGLKRKTWTRAEMDTLDAEGHLAGCRYELIEGEIFDKMGQDPPHASALQVLSWLLAEIFGLRHVRTQLPVEVAPAERERSIPEPDLLVTREPGTAYRTRHPEAADVLLVAEIADTTLAFDTTIKAGIYARAGYPEYWVVDVSRKQVIVFRDPADGAYQLRTVCRSEDNVSTLASPGTSIAVGGIFAA